MKRFFFHLTFFVYIIVVSLFMYQLNIYYKSLYSSLPVSILLVFSSFLGALIFSLDHIFCFFAQKGKSFVFEPVHFIFALFLLILAFMPVLYMTVFSAVPFPDLIFYLLESPLSVEVLAGFSGGLLLVRSFGRKGKLEKE